MFYDYFRMKGLRVWDYHRMKVCACEIITGGRGVLEGLLLMTGCTDGVRTTVN